MSDGQSSRRAGLWSLAAALLIYVLIAIPATWPLARHIGTRVAGDQTDPWQTYWGLWWWGNSYQFGDSPMYSRMLWWPHGIGLWLQTWDIPSAVAMMPFWKITSGPALYNIPLFLSFPLAGLACFMLCRTLWGGWLGPFLAGSIYTFSTYHYGHANATLHIASMQWPPIYFLGLVFVFRGRDLLGWVLLAVGLSLSTLASIYFAVFCAVGTLVFLVAHAQADGIGSLKALMTRPALLGLAIFALMTGWLLVGMMGTYLSEAFVGLHSPDRFSADLLSFVVPNGVNLLSTWIGDWRGWVGSKWTGTTKLWANSSFIGWTLIVVTVTAWRIRGARPYVVMAVVGALLALGPSLQIAGETRGGLMPYRLLVTGLPFLSFAGLPTRFTWLVIFGAAVAAGAVLTSLAAKGSRGRIAAVVITALVLAETWPRPMTLSSFEEPSILKAWSQDHGRWAVLDTTWWSRSLWHQTIHRHPIVGGFMSRFPERAMKGLERDRTLGPFFTHLIRNGYKPAAVPADEMIRSLRDLRIRYIIVDTPRAALPTSLKLAERYRGEGLVIFEVPGAATLAEAPPSSPASPRRDSSPQGQVSILD
jgi:hypothetical protein